MPLPDELLKQAGMLATIDQGIPVQANLRRSISASYYALYHLLVSESVGLLIPSQPRELSQRISRAFSHREIKEVCNRFSQSRLPSELNRLLRKPATPEMRSIAATFVRLQVVRHNADYDLSAIFLRSEALQYVADSQLAADHLSAVLPTDEARVFLTALAFGKRWAK